jgi:hypothetical protein
MLRRQFPQSRGQLAACLLPYRCVVFEPRLLPRSKRALLDDPIDVAMDKRFGLAA